MLRRRRSNHREDAEDRILPLINIVFLLLIFFMVVGTISASDPFEIAPLRSTSKGAPATEPVLVQIGPEGQLALNGALIDEASLVQAVKALRAQTDESDVRIKADINTDALMVVALLQKFRGVGVETVRLMTTPTLE